MYLVFIKNNNGIIIATEAAFVKGFQVFLSEKADMHGNIAHTPCKTARNVVKYSKCAATQKNYQRSVTF